MSLVKQLIEQIRSEPDPIARERAAATLARTLQRVNRPPVEETSIDQIIDLLHDDSDRVRLRIAHAIAAIGPPPNEQPWRWTTHWNWPSSTSCTFSTEISRTAD